jgi:hypothetical protein
MVSLPATPRIVLAPAALAQSIVSLPALPVTSAPATGTLLTVQVSGAAVADALVIPRAMATVPARAPATSSPYDAARWRGLEVWIMKVRLLLWEPVWLRVHHSIGIERGA